MPKIYSPVVLSPLDCDYDPSKKQFALLGITDDSVNVLFGPTQDLESLIKILEANRNYALRYLSPIQELKLKGTSYLVRAFHSGEIQDFQRLRNPKKRASYPSD
jgi:hypothetical protein